MGKSCYQWTTLHAILCTVTWLPDCLQGDVGAAQGPGLFFQPSLGGPSPSYEASKKREEIKGPSAPGGPDSPFSGPAYFSHLEENIAFTWQPVGWEDTYGKSQSWELRLPVDMDAVHTSFTI